MKNKLTIILLLFVVFLFSCVNVHKGGGIGDIVMTSSLNESQEKNLFIAEYSTPVFEYHDSTMHINFIFDDAYMEYAQTHVRKCGIRWSRLKPTQAEFFITHFSRDAVLDNYISDVGLHSTINYYKWKVLDQFYFGYREQQQGYGAIGRGSFKQIPDTISLVIVRNGDYYRHLPDSIGLYQHSGNDTIGVLNFYRRYK